MYLKVIIMSIFVARVAWSVCVSGMAPPTALGHIGMQSQTLALLWDFFASTKIAGNQYLPRADLGKGNIHF